MKKITLLLALVASMASTAVFAKTIAEDTYEVSMFNAQGARMK